MNENTIDSERTYMREISSIQLLSREQEQVLAGKMADGDLSAKTSFINANLRLVAKIAAKYKGKGVPFMDLIQEGNIAMMNAAEKFDYKRGYRFMTYAAPWIEQAVKKSVLELGNAIHIPANTMLKIHKINSVSETLMQELGREPKTEEIAEKMNCSAEDVITVKKMQIHVESLDLALGNEEEISAGEIIADQRYMDMDQEIIEKVCLSALDDVQKYVIGELIHGSKETLKDSFRVLQHILAGNPSLASKYESYIEAPGKTFSGSKKKEIMDKIRDRAVFEMGPDNFCDIFNLNLKDNSEINRWIRRIKRYFTNKNLKLKNINRMVGIEKGLEKKSGLSDVNKWLKDSGFREVYVRNYDELCLFCCLNYNDRVEEEQLKIDLEDYRKYIKPVCDAHYSSTMADLIVRDDKDYVFEAGITKQKLESYLVDYSFKTDQNRSEQQKFYTNMVTKNIRNDVFRDMEWFKKTDAYGQIDKMPDFKAKKKKLYEKLTETINATLDKYIEDITYHSQQCRYYVIKYLLEYANMCPDDKIIADTAVKEIFLFPYGIFDVQAKGENFAEIVEGKRDISRSTLLMYLLGIEKVTTSCMDCQYLFHIDRINEILINCGFKELNEAEDESFIEILNGDDHGYKAYGQSVVQMVEKQLTDQKKGSIDTQMSDLMSAFLFPKEKEKPDSKIEEKEVRQQYIAAMDYYFHDAIEMFDQQVQQEFLQKKKHPGERNYPWPEIRIKLMLSSKYRDDYYSIEPGIIRTIASEQWGQKENPNPNPKLVHKIRLLVHGITDHRDYLNI